MDNFRTINNIKDQNTDFQIVKNEEIKIKQPIERLKSFEYVFPDYYFNIAIRI